MLVRIINLKMCWRGSMAEQLICNQQVDGSTPFASSTHGRVPEWPKGADCKSVALRFDGSNPSPPTTSERVTLVPIFYFIKNQSPAPLFLLSPQSRKDFAGTPNLPAAATNLLRGG